MLVDSEPKEECYHLLNWVMAGKAQPNGGGSEMGKQPPCWDGESKVYQSNVKCSYLPLRGTYTDYGGMAL